MYGFSIDSLASGAVAERLQRAAEAVYRNIADPNTPALAKRTITLKIVFDPDEDREVAAAAMDVSVKLAPDKQIKTNFCIGVDDGGVARGSEMIQRGNPNQYVMDEKSNVRPLRDASGGGRKE